MPAISLIIANFNGEKHLADCLGSLRHQTHQDFETIFVDNGSVDASLATARALLPNIRILALPKNTGFARANNVGIQAATGQYVVLLNNDTRVHAEFLRELVQAVEQDERIGMVAPKILNFFDGQSIDSVGGLLVSPDGIGQGRGRGEVDRGQYDHLRDVLLPSGCAALYRKAMLDDIGLFSESFFAYCEDTDLGLRGVWAGWKAVAAPKAIVFHKYSATTSAYSPFKLQLVERNHYFVALKNFPPKLLALLPWWTVCRFGLMLRAVLAGRGKGSAAGGGQTWDLVAALVKGHWQALRGALQQLQQRRQPKRLSNRRFARMLKHHRISLRKLILSA